MGWVQVGVLLVLAVTVPLGLAVDPDFWWHLRTGRLIFESGIPTHDPFSWTLYGHNWVAHEWLAEAIIYATERAFGYVGNVILFGVLRIAALLFMYDLARRAGAGSRVLVLLTFLSVLIFFNFGGIRPQIFTWVLFAVFVHMLARDYEGERTPLWLLPVLMAAWANLHLGFVYGLMAVALWLAALAFAAARGRKRNLTKPALVLCACVLAACANPRGPALLWYPVQYFFEGRVDRSLVAEWQRPDFTDPTNAPLLLALIVLVCSIIVFRARRGAFLLLLTIVAAGLSLQALRNGPFAALLLLPVAGGGAAQRWPVLSRDRDPRTTIRASVALVVLVSLGVASAALSTEGRIFSYRDPPEATYPSAGAAYVKGNLPGTRLFNGYNWGGYLVYRLTPDIRVFIDGRADFYGADMLREYSAIGRVDADWQQRLDARGVQATLVRTHSELADAMSASSNWRLVFTGKVESVFVRVPEAGVVPARQGE